MWVFGFYMIRLPFIITVQEKVTHVHIGRLRVLSELSFIITVCGNVTHAHISCVYFLRLFLRVRFLCFVSVFLCLYKRKAVVSLCYTLGNSLYSMEFCNSEDTNDSWVFDVDETQFVEKDDDTMIWDTYHTEGSTDSWIWEVDESQYGGGDNSAVTENGSENDSTATESGTEALDESRYASDNDDAATENGTEEMDESWYDNNSVTEDDTGERFYTINEVRQVKSKKFRTTAMDYSVSFKGLEDLDVVQQSLNVRIIFDQLLNDITGGMSENDLIRFVLRTEQLDTPISLPFMSVSKLTPERLYSQIERVVQSHQEFRLNESVIADIVHVEMPEGRGKRKRDTIDLESYLESKRSVIRIRNNDDLCLARALVVAIAKADGDKRYSQLANHRKPSQKKAACELHEKAGVPFGPCGIPEVKQFQKHLPEYEINIVSSDHRDSIIYPECPSDTEAKRLYLYLHNNHYDVITSMPGFLDRSYFCCKCRKTYNSTVQHLCKGMCKMCRSFDCPYVKLQDCAECGRTFKSQACYDRHKEVLGAGQSVCQLVKKCVQCGNSVIIYNIPHHICGKTKCRTCKEFVNDKDMSTHLCYMKRPEKKDEVCGTSEESEYSEECDVAEESEYDQLMFFDYECRQEDGTHEPNLCIVHDEAGEEWIFSGENTNTDFCKWLFTKGHANHIFVAHNFQGYDGYFIQNFLNANGVKYDVIMTGAKIVTLTVPMFNIRFIDSLNFIPMALANFPKTFGLDELCKGYFPHLFNRRENQNYIGPIPPEPYYMANGMSTKRRKTFQEWHREQRDNDYVFDFAKEIRAYCRSDVDILRRSCMEFRELFRDSTGIDPFEKCLTIASACHLVYRTNFLKENTIAIFNSDRQLKMKQSNMAVKWLSYVAEKEGICIEHVRNGGEKRLGRYSLDGYHQESNTAYEFQGCLWHGE